MNKKQKEYTASFQNNSQWSFLPAGGRPRKANTSRLMVNKSEREQWYAESRNLRNWSHPRNKRARAHI